jgi:hypothetical protein
MPCGAMAHSPKYKQECTTGGFVRTSVKNKGFVTLQAAIIFQKEDLLLIGEFGRIVRFGIRIDRGRNSGARIGFVRGTGKNIILRLRGGISM